MRICEGAAGELGVIERVMRERGGEAVGRVARADERPERAGDAGPIGDVAGPEVEAAYAGGDAPGGKELPLAAGGVETADRLGRRGAFSYRTPPSHTKMG